MSDEFTGRRVVITGGSSGIGAALAAELSDRGARVGIIGRDAGKLADVAGRTGAVAVAADVADQAATAAAVEELAARLDGLDGLVNNAGVMLHSRIGQSRSRDWRMLVEVNILGVLHASVAAIPFLRHAAAAGGPSDLLTVGSAGSDRVALPEFAVYMSTKAAIRRIVEGLRLELAADLVRVSTVSPGTTNTEGHGPGIVDSDLRARLVAEKTAAGMDPRQVAAQIAAVLALPVGVSVPNLDVRPFPGG